jgi:hypothetical protein
MQFARLAVLAGCSVLAFAQAGFAAPTLVPMDEQVTTLASPASASPALPTFQYDFGSRLATLVTANPLLCGNTAAATGASPTGITPVYYSAYGSVGALPQPFVFGAAAATPTVSSVAYGATNLVYNGSQVQFGGDPLDALVCYGLASSDGVTFVRKTTRDLFADDFEVPGSSGILGNSSVALNVIQLPNAGNNNYYFYTIDVTIPPLPAGTDCNVLDCDFALLEGYDTSVLDPSSTSSQWCLAQTSNPTACGPSGGGTPPVGGGININFSNYSTFGSATFLRAPIAPAPAKVLHFYVYRKLLTGVTLPASGAPVVMAALFSPRDLEENKLDDNVATGNNTLANAAPIVSDDAAFTTAVSQLSEAADSASLSFTIQDPDSSQGSGTLSATANLTIAGQVNVMLPVSCSAPSGNPLASTCSLTVPLGSDPGGIWDTACGTLDPNPVSPPSTCYLDFATDPGNVAANMQIVVTDALGKPSQPVTVPVVISSSDNDAPVISFDANLLPATLDSNDSATYPTWTCSVSGSPAPACGTSSHGIIDVTITSVLDALPSPISAFDELSAQSTAVVPYSDPNDSYTDVQCTKEQADAVFATNGGPVVSAGTGTAYGMNFWLPATAPTSTVSALCILTMTDVESGGFPNSESAATAQSTFRIVVNP